MLLDVHCHLDDERFAADRVAVLARAQAAGVGAIITAGADVASSRAAVMLAEQFAPVWAVVGVHPEHAATFDAEARRVIRELAAHPKVIGIGEIGLDFYWQDNPPRETQARVFRAQLELAAELGKPVVVHDRDAHEDVMAILRAQNGAVRGILHCFAGDLAMARAAIELGFLISFGGSVTFKNAARLQAIAAALPLSACVLETDAPYLSPLRGQRNEPAYVPLIAARLAEILHISAARVAEQTTSNARTLFGLPEDG